MSRAGDVGRRRHASRVSAVIPEPAPGGRALSQMVGAALGCGVCCHSSSASFGTIQIQPTKPRTLTAAATTKAFV